MASVADVFAFEHLLPEVGPKLQHTGMERSYSLPRPGTVKQVTGGQAELDELAQMSDHFGQDLLVVEFCAGGTEHTRLAPAVAAMAAEFSDRAAFATVDVSQDDKITASLFGERQLSPLTFDYMPVLSKEVEPPTCDLARPNRLLALRHGLATRYDPISRGILQGSVPEDLGRTTALNTCILACSFLGGGQTHLIDGKVLTELQVQCEEEGSTFILILGGRVVDMVEGKTGVHAKWCSTVLRSKVAYYTDRIVRSAAKEAQRAQQDVHMPAAGILRSSPLSELWTAWKQQAAALFSSTESWTDEYPAACPALRSTRSLPASPSAGRNLSDATLFHMAL